MLPDIDSPTMFVLRGYPHRLIGFIRAETIEHFRVRHAHRWTLQDGVQPLIGFDYEDPRFDISISKVSVIFYGPSNDEVAMQMRNILTSQV